jgi:hypothetical protein
MNAKPLIVGGLVYLAITTSKKFGAAQKFQYSIDTLPGVRYESGRVNISVPLSITNMTNEQFDIKSVYGRVSVNNNYVGDFISERPVIISSYSKVFVPINAAVYLTNAISALISTLTNNTGGLVLTVNGSVVAGSLTLPLSITKKFR